MAVFINEQTFHKISCIKFVLAFPNYNVYWQTQHDILRRTPCEAFLQASFQVKGLQVVGFGSSLTAMGVTN